MRQAERPGAGDRERTLAAGTNDHIAKPIDIDEMFATLARMGGSAALFARTLERFRQAERDFVVRFAVTRAEG